MACFTLKFYTSVVLFMSTVFCYQHEMFWKKKAFITSQTLKNLTVVLIGDPPQSTVTVEQHTEAFSSSTRSSFSCTKNSTVLMIDRHQMPLWGVPHTRHLMMLQMNVLHNRRLVLNAGTAEV